MPADHPAPVPGPGPLLLGPALAALGATSITTQIVLLREFLTVFYGNELVIGLVLTNWMILTGLGAFGGRYSGTAAVPAPRLVAVLTGLALLPSLTVTLLRTLRNVVFIPGSMPGTTQALASSLILLAPFCLLSGLSFALFASALAERRQRKPVALAYSWEALGSAVGGAGFTLLLLPRLDTFQALALPAAVNLFLAIALAYSRHRGLALGAAILVCAIIATVGLTDPDTLTRRLLFPGQELIAFRDTPYGNLTVTRQGDQINFFENTVLMAATDDVTAAEESVHYALVQHPAPRRVLMIGGGISGSPQEILKYGVTAVDYAEINPWLIELGRAHSQALADPRIRVISDDARRYLRRTTARYDAALINLPDPDTAQLNRYFTVEFFDDLKRVLDDDAVISTSLLPAAEYHGPEAKLVTSSLYATLKRNFATVLIVPGNRNYFLASDGPLDIRIGERIERRGVQTAYVNRYYLDDRMLEDRSREITSGLMPDTAVNTDFAPVCYYQQLVYWLSSVGSSPWPWLGLALGTLAMMAWRFSVVGIGIFTAGLCASSFEIILLIAFQALYGSLYQMTGIVITVFMAGLAAGSWAVRRWAGSAATGTFITLQLMVAAFGMVLAAVLPRFLGAELSPTAIHLAFTVMTFTVAALIGMEFAVAAHLRLGKAAAVAGELYGLDLAGSALGALVVSVYAIPLLGLTRVSLVVGVASAISAGINTLWRGRPGNR